MENRMKEKIQRHKEFWTGERKTLLFLPIPELGKLDPNTETLGKYDTANYNERFYSPRKMWESETRRAKRVVEWPTDGIPAVRPNLGTIFIPAIAGQHFHIPEGQMPWVGDTLSVEEIESLLPLDVASAEIMQLAEDFYKIHSQSELTEIAAYQPDTQGVFDLAHLLYGEDLFLEMVTDPVKVHTILDVAYHLYLEVSLHLKKIMSESHSEMIHGHGTPQGLYFSGVGVRMSEDSAQMISPKMIDEFVIPNIVKASDPFGGTFIHFCGKHEALFQKMCELEEVQAIDLGNPEEYSLEWLFQVCAETDTVFYSRVMPENGENWRQYIRRIAEAQNRHRTKCVIRSLQQITDFDVAYNAYQLWHELTG